MPRCGKSSPLPLIAFLVITLFDLLRSPTLWAANPQNAFLGEYWNLPPTSGASPAFPTTAPTATRTDAAINFLWWSSALSATLQHTHLLFAWHHRRAYHTTGRLWRNRFRHEELAPERLLSLGQQIERLPVQAGLTKHPADYPYSSYAHYALGHTNPSLDSHPQYLALAPTAYRRQEQYGQLMRATR